MRRDGSTSFVVLKTGSINHAILINTPKILLEQKFRHKIWPDKKTSSINIVLYSTKAETSLSRRAASTRQQKTKQETALGKENRSLVKNYAHDILSEMFSVKHFPEVCKKEHAVCRKKNFTPDFKKIPSPSEKKIPHPKLKISGNHFTIQSRV